MKKSNDIAEKIFGVPYESLDATSKKVAQHITDRKHIARNTALGADGQASKGQRAADAVAQFGGSWTFIGLFAAILLSWIGLNSFILISYNDAFDPYPYILLNLFLSMLASFQAPVILMSQNRQSEKDRQQALNDYEVNLKAELDIMRLHEKIDRLQLEEWEQLIRMQREQLDLLARLAGPGR